MKTKLFGSFILVLFILFSCQKNQNIDQEVYPKQIKYLKTSAQCTTPLIAGQSINIGDVSVTYLDASNIEIDYLITDLNWCLTKTHLDVQTDPVNFPQTKKGNPKVGHFAYGQALGCVSIWSQTIDLNTIDGWSEGEMVYIAAHAEVNNVTTESAWADGEPFPGNNWAMYFECTPVEPLAIGDFYQGGVIFYLDGSGGGLICAVSDQSSTAEWGCFPILLSGADGTAIGTGAQNTIDIEAGCTTPGTAADLCANLSSNGYTDWFLPSNDELIEMQSNKAIIDATAVANGGSTFVTYASYWSSTEYDHESAWNQWFDNDYQDGNNKGYPAFVRAIRAF